LPNSGRSLLSLAVDRGVPRDIGSNEYK